MKLGQLVPTVGVLVVLATADAATLKDKARLRDGPSKEASLLGWLDEGTNVTLEAERSGWYVVRTPDGRSGYVWRDHLSFEPGEEIAGGSTTATTSTPLPTPTVPATAPATLAVDPTPAPPTPEHPQDQVGLELERLRTEVARLATSQQELLQRLNRGAPGASADPSSEPIAGPAVIFLAAGTLIGLVASWVWQSRRDRRPRIRL